MGKLSPTEGNFFKNIPDANENEIFEPLIKTKNVVVERITSLGQRSNEWYDQEEAEFCSVLQGYAELLFEGESKARPMIPGSWIFIPPHAKHKVTVTTDTVETIWIAMKWREESN